MVDVQQRRAVISTRFGRGRNRNGGGVLLAACCLLLFTLVGSSLIERIGWLKPVAGLALVVIGLKLAIDFARS